MIGLPRLRLMHSQMIHVNIACRSRKLFVLRLHRCWASTGITLPDGTENLSKEHQMAQNLIYNQNLTEGSYGQLQFLSAARLIRLFKDRTDPTSVNLAIQLWERWQRESFLTKDENFDESHVMGESDLVVIVNNWRAASKKGEKVMTPTALMQKLQNLSQRFPQFSHSVKVVSMIMDVALQTVKISQSPQEASLLAEEFLEFLQDADENSLGQSLRPNVYIYTQALKAHAESGQPDAPKKIDAVLDQMQKNGVELTVITFNILLRFYGSRGDAEQLDDLLDTMREKGLNPSRTSLAQAIYGYSIAKKIDKAEELLNQMVQLTPVNRIEERLIGECILNILFAYRRVIVDKRASGIDKVRAVGSAEDLIKRMEKFAFSGDDESKKIIGTMMDCYSRAGVFDHVKMIFEQLTPNVVANNILIKTYGKFDMAPRATALLKSMLHDPDIAPNIWSFNSTLTAWAKSSKPDVFEQANAIYQLLDEDSRCKELGIQPDTITFNSLLCCLVASKSTDVNFAAIAKSILEKMEQSASNGQLNVAPDVRTWNLVLKACIKSGDINLINEMIERMEESKTILEIKTYTEVLKFFSMEGTTASANRAEQILVGMEKIAETRQPDLKPDVICYDVVITAHKNCGSMERMWFLYEQMISKNIHPDLRIYTMLIATFSRSQSREYMVRASTLLEKLEQSSSALLRPDFRHFVSVIRGWLRFGDIDRATDVLMRSIDAYLVRKNSNALLRDWVTVLILKGWIRQGDLLRATSFLGKLEEQFSAGLPSPPSKRCYALLIDAWEKSKLPEKSEIVKELIAVSQR